MHFLRRLDHQKIPIKKPCDMLLLKEGAVVNEAMLTGEIDLQVKEAIDSNQYPVGQSLDIDDQLSKMSVDSSFNKNPVSV